MRFEDHVEVAITDAAVAVVSAFFKDAEIDPEHRREYVREIDEALREGLDGVVETHLATQ